MMPLICMIMTKKTVKFKFSFTFAIFCGLLFAFIPTRGYGSDSFLFGSKRAALAGSGAVQTETGGLAYAASLNPAALSLLGDLSKKIALQWGAVASYPKFLDIRNVVVENSYTTSKTQPTTGDVSTNYDPIIGQVLGLSVLLLPNFGNLTFGMTGYLPVRQITYIDTGETFLPEYVIYRMAGQVAKFDFAFGGTLHPTLRLGTGLHIAYSVSSSPSIFLRSNSTGPSSMRFVTSIRPKLAPYFGLLWMPRQSLSENNPSSEKSNTSPSLSDFCVRVGSVISFASSSDFLMSTKSSAQLFNGLSALDLNFGSSSVLTYDPLKLQTGLTWDGLPISGFKTFFQIDLETWSRFKSPAISIEDPSGVSSCPNTVNCGINITPGRAPPYFYKNILIPRIGEEITIGSFVTRFGYAYRPSILSNLSTEAGNYIDPPKHIFTMGFGLPIMKLLGVPLDGSLDIHFHYHRLITQQITKSSGDEAGLKTTPDPNASQKVGAPGYSTGGKILGGGLSLSFTL